MFSLFVRKKEGTVNETPKETFRRLQGQLGTVLLDIHTLFTLQKAPEEVTRLFSLEFAEEASIANLIARTLEEHPAKFLE